MDSGLDILIACHIRYIHDSLFVFPKKYIFNKEFCKMDEHNNKKLLLMKNVVFLPQKLKTLPKQLKKIYNINSIDYLDKYSGETIIGSKITNNNGISSQLNYKTIGDKKYDFIFTIHCPLYEDINLFDDRKINDDNVVIMLSKYLKDNGKIFINSYKNFDEIIKKNYKGWDHFIETVNKNKINIKMGMLPDNTDDILSLDFFINYRFGENPTHILYFEKNDKKQEGGDMNLYSPNRLGKTPRVKTGFSNKKIAKQTIKNIEKYDKNYQKQVVITMYNRAKFHPYRTKFMVEAMNIFSNWMKKNGVKLSRTKKIKM